MKISFSKFIAVIALVIGSWGTAHAQFIIKVRPGPPVARVRPVCPGPAYVWVAGDYVWHGGTYVYKEGYWVMPPRGHRMWKEGRWRHRRGGWVWVPGHWK